MHLEPVLEFEQLRELLGRYLQSPIGRAELARLGPSPDRDLVETRLADVREAVAYLDEAMTPKSAGGAGRLRFAVPADPTSMVARLRIEGASLEATEIREVARLLEVAAEVRSQILGVGNRYPRLAAHASEVADLKALGSELSDKIQPDGTLADNASVALSRIRRDSERQRKQIESSLERFLRTHRDDGTLQEEFVTIRNDRWVVPVVAGKERRVDGVIHGSSGSGHSMFVEPLETIALNNELVRLSEEELREIHRILREFTGRLREHAREIAESVAAMGRLELLLAKAEYTRAFDCCVPRLSSEDRPRIDLRNARHPLLADILRKQKRPLVPMSVQLDEDQTTLLISGPNTGGKTVALKTMGLLALMTQAGIPVPADLAEFPMFDQVLADIGDHQSLAESLSSFSSHIAGVKRIWTDATHQSLVLLDELGRATDPEEGGALGVTVLESFRKVGAFTVASTHLTAMKIYGASTPGVLNGSMGFDDETLEPTYQLRLGAPGKSAGLDIASRLGLEPSLIAEARGRMSTTERDVAHFLAELNRQLEELRAEKHKLDAWQETLDEREKSLEQNWERKYSAKIHELEAKARELSEQFEQRAQATLQDLSQKARAKVAKTRREFQEAVAELAPPAPTAAGVAGTPQAPARLKLEPGVRVRLKGIRQPATVRRVREDGIVEVEAGFLKMQVPVTDIDEVLPAVGAAAKPTGIRFNQSSMEGPSWDGGYREIKLIGYRAEEARELVDKFLDTAALAQVERVRIVHGHGMGVLKRTIAELLAESPYVEKFYPASAEEGGAGATIAELK